MRPFGPMLTPSEMRPLGAHAAPFDLPDTEGNQVQLADFASANALLVCFLCAHCDATTHIAKALGEFGIEYRPRGLALVGINSNDDTYRVDKPENMPATAAQYGWSFPYLFDETQDIARAYAAACTPDFFLFDRERALVYRGQFDGSRPGNGVPVTGEDLRAAADAVLVGRAPSPEQKPSLGCNIKWRYGEEPEYFQPNFIERMLRQLRRLK